MSKISKTICFVLCLGFICGQLFAASSDKSRGERKESASQVSDANANVAKDVNKPADAKPADVNVPKVNKPVKADKGDKKGAQAPKVVKESSKAPSKLPKDKPVTEANNVKIDKPVDKQPVKVAPPPAPISPVPQAPKPPVTTPSQQKPAPMLPQQKPAPEVNSVKIGEPNKQPVKVVPPQVPALSPPQPQKIEAPVQKKPDVEPNKVVAPQPPVRNREDAGRKPDVQQPVVRPPVIRPPVVKPPVVKQPAPSPAPTQKKLDQIPAKDVRDSEHPGDKDQFGKKLDRDNRDNRDDWDNRRDHDSGILGILDIFNVNIERNPDGTLGWSIGIRPNRPEIGPVREHGYGPEHGFPIDRQMNYERDRYCQSVMEEISAVENINFFDRTSYYMQFAARPDLCGDAQVLLVDIAYNNVPFKGDKVEVILTIIANPRFTHRAKSEILNGLGTLIFDSYKAQVLDALNSRGDILDLRPEVVPEAYDARVPAYPVLETSYWQDDSSLPVDRRPIFEQRRRCEELIEKITAVEPAYTSFSYWDDRLDCYMQFAKMQDLCEDAQVLLVSKIYNAGDSFFCHEKQTDTLLTLISNPVFTKRAAEEARKDLGRISDEEDQGHVINALNGRAEFFDRQIIPDARVPENYIPPDRLSIFIGDERCRGIITEIYATGNLTSCYDRLNNYKYLAVRRDLCEDAQVLLVKSVYVTSSFDENKTEILLALIANPVFAPRCKTEILKDLGNLGFESNKKRILQALNRREE